jgi:hypothetical protein
MSTLDPSSLAWMREHHATISTERLRAGEVTVDQQRALVGAGILQRVVDGAYSFGGVDPDETAKCAALCASRPQLVVAGPTAGRLWELRRSPRDGVVHVIAPPASQPCRMPWVRPYRTSFLFPEEVVMRPDGIRLTSPPRTVVDLTRYVDAVALASVIEHALSRRLCTVSTLHRCAERLNTPGRPWLRRFLDVLARRHPTAAAQSEAELLVFRALTDRGVRGLERQVRVFLPGYGRAFFDLAMPDLCWALEVDVHPEHRSLEGRANDLRRDDGAEAAGWRVRRVSELELRPGWFATTVTALLASIDRRRDEVEALKEAGRWYAHPTGR